MSGRVTKRDPRIVQTHGKRRRVQRRIAVIGKGIKKMDNSEHVYSWLAASIVLTVISLLLLALGGCNTIAGVGADIQAAAKGTQDYLAGDRKVGSDDGDVTWDR